MCFCLVGTLLWYNLSLTFSQIEESQQMNEHIYQIFILINLYLKSTISVIMFGLSHKRETHTSVQAPILLAALQKFIGNVSRLSTKHDCLYMLFHVIWSNLLSAFYITLKVQQEIPQDARQSNPIKARAPKSLVRKHAHITLPDVQTNWISPSNQQL